MTAIEPITPYRIDASWHPSILQQTKWQCEFFDFRKANISGFSYFNCGLVRRPDGLWLITRRSKNDPRLRIGINDMVAWLLEEKEMMPEYGRKISPPIQFPGEHFEDPRAIYHNGKTYVSACNFVVTNGGASWTGAHQMIAVLNDVRTAEWKVSARIDPIYGNNGPRIGADKGMEKNWLWFFHDDLPHLVYQAYPHRVVRFNESWKQDFVHESGGKSLPWEFGIIRGGTPPALSPDGKEYFTFFHSSLKVEGKFRRRYYMGAYAFEAKPPFRMTRITPKPLLAGSSQDRWAERKPLVVFPCGCEFKNDNWTITFGVNDLWSAWIRIPYYDLVERMVDVIPRERGIFSSLFKANVLPVVTDEYKPKEPAKPKTFHHSGDAVEIIFGMAAIKAAGGGELFIENTKDIISLIEQQQYISRSGFTVDDPSCDYSFGRDSYAEGESMVDHHFKAIGIPPDYKPWLTVDYQSEVPGRHIVVSRSHANHNDKFPWLDLVSKHGRKMIFVGSETEHSDFIKQFGAVPRASTANLLDVARTIKGAWLFIGNQSVPLAIAIGLGHDRIIQEVSDGPECSTWNIPERNMMCVKDGKLDVPKKWFG